MDHSSMKLVLKKLNQKCIRDLFKQPYCCMYTVRLRKSK